MLWMMAWTSCCLDVVDCFRTQLFECNVIGFSPEMFLLCLLNLVGWLAVVSLFQPHFSFWLYHNVVHVNFCERGCRKSDHWINAVPLALELYTMILYILKINHTNCYTLHFVLFSQFYISCLAVAFQNFIFSSHPPEGLCSSDYWNLMWGMVSF